MPADERAGVCDLQAGEVLLVDEDRDLVGRVDETQHEPVPLRARVAGDLPPDDEIRVEQGADRGIPGVHDDLVGRHWILGADDKLEAGRHGVGDQVDEHRRERALVGAVCFLLARLGAVSAG